MAPGDRDVVQFGGKVRAHNPEKAGAEFWSARREFSDVLQIPACKSSGAAGHDIHRTGQAAIGDHVPDELTGSKRHSGAVAENGFDISGYDNKSFR
jgi:hypothetical protein